MLLDWMTYKGKPRYKTVKFRKDYEIHGEQLRHDVAHSLLSDKKKLNKHDKTFLAFLGYIVNSDGLEFGKETLNGHTFFKVSEASYKWQLMNPVIKSDGLTGEEIMEFCQDVAVLFENSPSDIARQIFLPEQRMNKALRLRFVSKDAEKDFLTEFRERVRFLSNYDFPSFAKRLKLATKTDLSLSYIVHYLHDKA